MHLIAVNLWVWVRTVILEEYEVSREIDNAQYENAHALFVPLSNVNLSKVQKIGSSEESGEHDKFQTSHGDDDDILHLVMGCANTESCFMRQTFGPIMSTCTIEYSLIAACVMYVLWRNIGMPISAEHKARKRSLRVDCSSSTTGMFAGLVFLVGTFVSMIIFYSKMSTNRDADALWVFSLTHTALYLASIVACLFGIWRMRAMSYDSDRHATGAKLLEDILLIVGLIGQLLFSISGIVGLAGASQRDDVSPALYAVLGAHAVRLLQVLLQTVFILGASQLVATTSKLQATKPGREIVTFMMVVNMALFLVNTFEGQKASVNRALVDFYGMEAWALVVQSTMPLSIFYRFHSSVCLAEIWKHSYRVHVRPITL
uniref:Otopetrin-2 n=1 Tax=Plectus sambesii TaxID=2011161 RepID=A0A914UNS6_9BILA